MSLCFLCASETASVLVPIAAQDGDPIALPAIIPIGAACLDLLRTDQDRTLESRLSADFFDLGPAEVVAHLRLRAGEPSATLPEPPSTTEAHTRGFVPLSDYTGVGADLGPLWPEAHRVSRLQLSESPSDPNDFWLVRSPWRSLSVSEVIMVLWRWVDRDHFPSDEEERTSRVLEVFRWDETEARRLL